MTLTLTRTPTLTLTITACIIVAPEVKAEEERLLEMHPEKYARTPEQARAENKKVAGTAAKASFRTYKYDGADPAAEAAKAVAQAEAEGLTLVRSARNSTGYTGVTESVKGRTGFTARVSSGGGKTKGIGSFLTAQEAALAIARRLAQKGEVELQRTRLTGRKRKPKEEDEDEGEGEEETGEEIKPLEWLQCDKCNKWRIVPNHGLEGASEQWYCEMP